MARFRYRMQNILDIKIKLETQARNEYGIANQKYLEEQDKLQQLVVKRVTYETKLKELMNDIIDIRKVNSARRDVNTIKSLIRTQMFQVKKAEDELEIKRAALADVMAERKTHERLRDKAFERFQQEEKAVEAKEIDELVSFNYNSDR